MTGKKKKSKVKKEIDLERDLTILKDPKVFIDNLIKVRNLWEPDVLTRVSMDGDGSLKIIANVFSRHQDPQVTFKYQGGKGESLSGVNKAIILAYCEDLQESHYNMGIILELLQIHELHGVIASDLKLINIILGLSSQGGKYTCVYCEEEKKELSTGRLRSFGRLNECFAGYVAQGSKERNMKNHYNVIHECLLDGDPETLVLHIIPPPELHLLMGVVNHLLEIIRLHMISLDRKCEL